MNLERLEELAVAFASGEITEGERAELHEALARASAAEREKVAAIIDSSAQLAALLPPEAPPASLKEKIKHRVANIAVRKPFPSPGLHFIRNAAAMEWMPMKVPGAYVKLLQMNQEQGYAVALGKLDPGATYPAHSHKGPEEILILTGDLFIGATRLQAGDFHHADAGSYHEVNRSDEGCTILIVLSTEDLMAQMA